MSDKKDIPMLNLADAQQTELRSHFDVVRKLGYLPNLNSLVSISEVFLNKLINLRIAPYKSGTLKT